ncbi:MAG: phosphotransferase [bacterium]|nr:phosphotransferase [bacterium]
MKHRRLPGTEEGLWKITNLSIKPFEPESTSSLLLVEVAIKLPPNKVPIQFKLVVHGEIFGLNPIPQLEQRLSAQFASTLQEGAHQNTWLHRYFLRKTDQEANYEACESVMEVARIPLPLPGATLIQTEQLHVDTKSLFTYFKDMGNRDTLSAEDMHVAKLISDKLHELQSQREIPVSFPDMDKISLDTLDREALDEEYDTALMTWRAHFWNYLRPRPQRKGPHPVLTPALRQKFNAIMDMFVDGFAGRGDRLVIIHGDLWAPNILLKQEHERITQVQFIDRHRGPYFDRQFDFGRLLFDGLYWFDGTQNPVYLKWNKYLLTIHKKLTGDPELEEAVFFGLLSRLFSKLHPESSRDFNPERILRLCNVLFIMADRGRYEVIV